jgi:hypothetical protein
MEAASTSKTSVSFYQTARCYNPEDSIFTFLSVLSSLNPQIEISEAKCRSKDLPNMYVSHECGDIAGEMAFSVCGIVYNVVGNSYCIASNYRMSSEL